MRLWVFVAGRWYRRAGTGVRAQKCHALQAGVAAVGGVLWNVRGLAAFMGLAQILPPFLVLAVAGLLLATATAGLASLALSGLCQSAALLREESEMTV